MVEKLLRGDHKEMECALRLFVGKKWKKPRKYIFIQLFSIDFYKLIVF